MFGRRRKDGNGASSSGSEPALLEEGRGSSHPAKTSRAKGSRQKQKKLDDIPARRVPHKVFIAVSLLTGLCALGMAAGQVLGMVVYENTVVTYVLRGYVVLLCGLVVLIEAEWPRAVRETPLFGNWITRGLLYAFIGVVGMQENDSSEVVVNRDSESYEMIADIVVAVAWNMIGCGILYFLMGLLCLHWVLNRLRKDYQERLERARERQNQQDDDEDEGEGEEVVLQDTNQAAIEAAQSAFADGKESKLDWAREEKDDSESLADVDQTADSGTETWAEEDGESVTEKSSAEADWKEPTVEEGLEDENKIEPLEKDFSQDDNKSWSEVDSHEEDEIGQEIEKVASHESAEGNEEHQDEATMGSAKSHEMKPAKE